MKIKLLIKIFFGALIILAVLATGCKKNAGSGGADGLKILKFGNSTEPRGLDPHLSTGVTENNIISALIEGLISYHPTDDNIAEPAVADRWEHEGNHKNWTFHIRENAKWSNGESITAHDFVFSYKRMLSPTLGAEYAYMLYVVENAEAFNTSKITDFAEVGIKAIDDQTLQFKLRNPTPYFLSMLKHYAWFPVHPGTIKKFGKIDDRISKWTRPENYVGNGPFILHEWKINHIITVKRNPHYWDTDKVQLDGIHFLPIDNANTENNSFMAGQLHITGTVPTDKIPYYRKNRPDLIHLDPYLGTYFYRINLTRKPLDNPLVRKALSLSLNRKDIVEKILNGGQRQAFGFTPNGMSGYETPQPLKFNPQEAKKLLAKAGFPNGKGFPAMEILINTSESHRRIAEAIQEMWRKTLNIDIKILNQEWKVYLDSQTNLDYDISRSGWIGDYMDPVTFLNMWLSNSGNNDTGWKNKKYDDLIEQAKREANPERRYQLLQTAENILLDEVPIIPIYWYTRIYLLDPKVKGWNPKLLDNHPYKYVYLEE